MQFSAEPAIVKEFERRLRVQDSVIKFLTVRIDETLKRLDKRKKEREKRAHRRPQAPAPQPSLAQQMLGGGAEGAHPLPGAPVAAPVAHPAPGAPVATTEPATEVKES
jgi:small subunit ribosomal protein S6